MVFFSWFINYRFFSTVIKYSLLSEDLRYIFKNYLFKRQELRKKRERKRASSSPPARTGGRQGQDGLQHLLAHARTRLEGRGYMRLPQPGLARARAVRRLGWAKAQHLPADAKAGVGCRLGLGALWDHPN